MRRSNVALLAIGVVGLTLAGCAGEPNTSLIQTSSVEPVRPASTVAQAKPKLDANCVALNKQIENIRREGTPVRVGDAAKGKTRSVVMKRAALAKMVELDRLNWEFQARCSPYPLQAAIENSAPVKEVPKPKLVAPKPSKTVKQKPVSTSAVAPRRSDGEAKARRIIEEARASGAVLQAISDPVR